MTFNYIIKGVKITPVHIIAVLALLSIGGAAVIFDHPVGTHPMTDNPIIAAASSGQHSSFRDQRIDEAQGVENIVNNVLSGAVKPGDGRNRLVEIRLYAKGDIDLSKEDMDTNLRYVDYVMSSEDVVNSYMYKTGNVDEMLTVMKDKKNKI